MLKVRKAFLDELWSFNSRNRKYIFSNSRRNFPAKHTLNYENMNPNIKNMDSFVFSEVNMKAEAISKEIKEGGKRSYPYVISSITGDPHANDQKPITFFRQVLAQCLYPVLLEKNIFPADTKIRANEILNSYYGRSLGSYSPSLGSIYVREKIADFLTKRDGVPSSYEDIVLTSGTPDTFRKLLTMFVPKDESQPPPGVLLPLPILPLYTCAIDELGLYKIGYHMDEKQNWEFNIIDVKNAYVNSSGKCVPKIMLVINPHNPTGVVLTEKNIEDIVQFSCDNNLFLIVDENHQYDIYDPGASFHSFKKVMTKMGMPYSKRELASMVGLYHGYVGEGGLRGQFTEIVNLYPAVKDLFINLFVPIKCSPTPAQVVLCLMCDPPQVGDVSFPTYLREKNEIIATIKQRAKLMEKGFNSLPGMSCKKVQGGMFAYPSMEMPEKAREEAAKLKIRADAFYCLELLETAGVCLLPGSGFGQRPGTWHFGCSIMLAVHLFEEMIGRLQVFNEKFFEKYK